MVNKAIKAVSEEHKPTNLTRHEWDKVLEALPILVKAKQRKLKALTEDYMLNEPRWGKRYVI